MDLPEPPRPDLRTPPPAPPTKPKPRPSTGFIVAMVISGLIVLGGIGTAVGGGSDSGSSDSSGIDSGLGTQDASGDVSVGDCETDFGLITCDVTIVNSSDGRSDCYIEATIEDPSGANVGTANTLVLGGGGRTDGKG
jgi:hypothetical protein